MIEKSEKEYVGLKDVQLKKMQTIQETEQLTLEEQKSELVNEESTNVQTLKSIFEGPAAHEKALEKTLSQVQQEIERSQTLVKERLAQSDIVENKQAFSVASDEVKATFENLTTEEKLAYLAERYQGS